MMSNLMAMQNQVRVEVKLQNLELKVKMRAAAKDRMKKVVSQRVTINDWRYN